jgi:hypothetical protein
VYVLNATVSNILVSFSATWCWIYHASNVGESVVNSEQNWYQVDYCWTLYLRLSVYHCIN